MSQVVDLHNVGEHRPSRKEAALMWVNVLCCKPFPSESESAGNKPVVCVGYCKWSGRVAVVGGLAVFGCGGGFLGETHQNSFVELGVVLSDVLLRVHRVQCLPENVCSQRTRCLPREVRYPVGSWRGGVGKFNGTCQILFRGFPSACLCFTWWP